MKIEISEVFVNRGDSINLNYEPAPVGIAALEISIQSHARLCSVALAKEDEPVVSTRDINQQNRPARVLLRTALSRLVPLCTTKMKKMLKPIRSSDSASGRSNSKPENTEKLKFDPAKTTPSTQEIKLL